jgi:hypothetical protein
MWESNRREQSNDRSETYYDHNLEHTVRCRFGISCPEDGPSTNVGYHDGRFLGFA